MGYSASERGFDVGVSLSHCVRADMGALDDGGAEIEDERGGEGGVSLRNCVLANEDAVADGGGGCDELCADAPGAENGRSHVCGASTSNTVEPINLFTG